MTRSPSVGVGGHWRGMSCGMGISRCGRVTPLSSPVQSISLWAGHGDFGASTQSHESGHLPWAERECVDSTLRRRADDRWRVPMEGDGEVAFVWFAHTNDGYVSRRVGLLRRRAGPAWPALVRITQALRPRHCLVPCLLPALPQQTRHLNGRHGSLAVRCLCGDGLAGNNDARAQLHLLGCAAHQPPALLQIRTLQTVLERAHRGVKGPDLPVARKRLAGPDLRR
jgi:hypothetical protein